MSAQRWRYRSPLATLQSDPMDIERIKRCGSREQRILEVSACDDRLDFVEREWVRRLGERLYGARGARRASR